MNLLHGWIYLRGESFQEWIFFRGEYFLGWIFFRGKYYTAKIFHQHFSTSKFSICSSLLLGSSYVSTWHAFNLRWQSGFLVSSQESIVDNIFLGSVLRKSETIVDHTQAKCGFKLVSKEEKIHQQLHDFKIDSWSDLSISAKHCTVYTLYQIWNSTLNVQ